MWEPICGYSRAVRIGDRILVSGTTATHGAGEAICPGDAERAGGLHPRQDRGEHRSRSAARIGDVVRTRVYLRSADDWEPVSRVHGRVFGAVRPANTLLEVSRLVGEYLVEIEAEAVVG